jgi:hypothetical protein
MQDTNQSRRTLTARSAYQASSATLAAEQLEYHRQQQAAEQQRDEVPQAEGKKRAWSQDFETRCLLIVGDRLEQDPSGRRFFCKHTRRDGTVIGTVIGRFPWNAPPPEAGTLIEVAGVLNMLSAERPDWPPRVRIQVAQWALK